MRVAEHPCSFPGWALDGTDVNFHAVNANVDYRHAHLGVSRKFAHGGPAPRRRFGGVFVNKASAAAQLNEVKRTAKLKMGFPSTDLSLNNLGISPFLIHILKQ